MTNIPEGYKPHDGSGMPDDVHPDSKPGVLFRDGVKLEEGIFRAGGWVTTGDDWWSHEGDPSDNIIAYLPDPDFKET
jgi:hypothetical protein